MLNATNVLLVNIREYFRQLSIYGNLAIDRETAKKSKDYY